LRSQAGFSDARRARSKKEGDEKKKAVSKQSTKKNQRSRLLDVSFTIFVTRHLKTDFLHNFSGLSSGAGSANNADNDNDDVIYCTQPPPKTTNNAARDNDRANANNGDAADDDDDVILCSQQPSKDTSVLRKAVDLPADLDWDDDVLFCTQPAAKNKSQESKPMVSAVIQGSQRDPEGW